MNVELHSSAHQRSPAPARRWDEELADTTLMPQQIWPEPGYNVRAIAQAGLLPGALAGSSSLVFSMICSVLWPVFNGEAQHPLWMIQVYLTFPFGESALDLGSGVLLALGCLLYLATGALYGTIFSLAISYFTPRADWPARLVACSLLALLVWAGNFYLLLSWLQPLLFGGQWILDLLPWWVAAVSHLVFGWTIALLLPGESSQSQAERSRSSSVLE